MSKPLFILISGKRLSGKDTVANILSELLKDKTIEITHLADAIRKEVMDLYPHEITNIKQLADNDDPIKKKYRPELIRIGQERRAVNVDHWCEVTLEDGLYSGKDVVIIPDIRFPNELKFFRKQEDIDTFAIRVSATPEARAARGYEFTQGVDNDVSEVSLDIPYEKTKWDTVLVDAGMAPYLVGIDLANSRYATKEISMMGIAQAVERGVLPLMLQIGEQTND